MATPAVSCKECGTVDTLRWDDSTNKRLVEWQVCFTCYHWLENMELDKAQPDIFAIVDAHHYVIGTEPSANAPRYLLGFGGARKHFRFHDGREVISHNVWYQGKIPNHFRERMPDNAVIITTSVTL